jgi:hypothetical protein
MFQPIAGYRIQPLPNHLTGQLARPKEWKCWRCGQTVKNHSYLVPNAPCKDCRDVLKLEGDTEIYDIRRLPR